jgi:hypothetical protein
MGITLQEAAHDYENFLDGTSDYEWIQVWNVATNSLDPIEDETKKHANFLST